MFPQLPAVDAIDFDDENNYDADSMRRFALMLGDIGFDVTVCPYTNPTFWTSVVQTINTERPGTVTAVHLQCYSGAGNSPCQRQWNFGEVPVYGGLDSSNSPEAVDEIVAGWHNQCAVTGAFMWIYDDFYTKKGASKAYAGAIMAGLDGKSS